MSAPTTADLLVAVQRAQHRSRAARRAADRRADELEVALVELAEHLRPAAPTVPKRLRSVK